MAAAPQTTKNLGVFDDEQKAASAYDTAVRPAAAARLALTTEEYRGVPNSPDTLTDRNL